MPKCILHVGMHKTGSTSIQNSLKDLDDDSFYYAHILGRPNHSLSIASIFAKGGNSHVARKRFARGQDDLEAQAAEARRDLKASIDAAKGRTLVISGEGILRMSSAELQKLKDYLERHGYDDIEIFAYVRAPAGYISSAIQQKIKTGTLAVLKIKGSAPSYRDKFEKFDEVFSAGKVKLFKFDPETFPGRDVVNDFCARAGIPLSSITPIRKNESITRLAAQLRFQYTAHAEAEGLRPMKGGMGNYLSNRLRDLDPTRFRLAPSVVKPFIDAMQTDIDWMEKRLGQSLSESLEADGDNDIRSEEDLLKPVPGINEKLRAILVENGETVPESVAENTWKLLFMIARSEMRDRSEEDAAQGGGSISDRKAQRRAKLLLERQERKAGRAGGRGDAEVSEDRAGRKAGRGAARTAEAKAEREAERKAARREERRAARRAEKAASRAEAAPAAAIAAAVPGASAAPGSKPALTPQERMRKRQERQLALAGATASGASDKPDARAVRALRSNMRAAGEGRKVAHGPLTMAPMPLLNKDKGLVVLWSPKSACTTVYVWFSHVSGFSEEVRNYASWPHRHRIEQFMKSELYADSAESGMDEAKILRIIRDPYSRAVSIYRHALQTHFADKDMEAFSGGKISAEEGYSFQTFLDMLEQLDMRRVDIHFRPQVHPFEQRRKADRVINISKQDLFTELNAFEVERGFTKTNFEDLNWLHHLESKRKAKQEPMEGESLDTMVFTRKQVAKLGQFPSYKQLLTPAAKQRIEAIYKPDFDAYRDFL